MEIVRHVTDVRTGKEVRLALNAGIQKVRKAVQSTLGANGANVLYADNLEYPRVTKDGVSVARMIMLHDYTERAGAEILKQTAESSAELAGDGTTTATVLGGKLTDLGVNLPDNIKHFELRKGMKKAVEAVTKSLKKQAVNIENNLEMLKMVATVSANHDQEIGQRVAEIVSKSKLAPIILSKEMREFTEYEAYDCFEYPKPLPNPELFSVEGDSYQELEDTYVLIIDDNVNDIGEIFEPLKWVLANDGKLVVMANTYSQNFLNQVWNNILNNVITSKNFMTLNLPSVDQRRMEALYDLKNCLGGNIFGAIGKSSERLSNFDPEMLGKAKKIIADHKSTKIVFTEEGDVEAKKIVEKLQEAIKTKKGSEKDRLQERIDRLGSGTGTLYIGAKTDTEHKELYDLYEDAYKACQSALQEGIVDGGGLALYRASKEVKIDTNKMSESEKEGVRIVLETCQEPLKAIIESSGLPLEEVLDKIEKTKFKKGLNAKTGEIVDLKKAGIIDPVKVTRVALESAEACATTILTTKTVITPFDFRK